MKLASSYTNGTPMLQNWRKRKTSHKTDEKYAKQQLSKEDTKTAILGISWNKQDGQLEVKFPQRQTEATKGRALQ